MDARRKPSRKGKGSRTQPVVVLEPVLVPITDDDERRALEALIELLVPLFTESQPENTRENE